MKTILHLSEVLSATLFKILLLVVLAIRLNLRAQSETAKQTASDMVVNVDVSTAEYLRPSLPIIPDLVVNLSDFGAVGDGKTMNTAAFKRAIIAVEKAGGGKLVVPKGVFCTAPFTLCSKLELHLEAGAVIKAPETFAELGLPDPSTFKTQTAANAVYHFPNPLISGSKLHDVALTGAGTIDGSGQHWWDWSERAARNAAKTQPGRIVYLRLHLVVIDGCDRLLVVDITLANSAMFHLVPKRVNNLTIERVKVRAPFNAPNTDAIDPGPGTNFWIHDCDIDTGDDDIVIKSGGANILIENNTIKHGHGISIGSDTTAGVHNMLVRHCIMDGTDNGIRIKSMRGAGGLVENVRYTDITMKNVGNAIVFQLDYVDNNRPDFKGASTKIPVIRSILLDHLTIDGARNAGIIHGLPDSLIRNLMFRDITLIAGKDFDIRNAEEPVCECVARTIKPGVGPVKIPGEH